jgi:hypothetical protein
MRRVVAIRNLDEVSRISVKHRFAARCAKKVLFALVFTDVLCRLFIDVHIANGIFCHISSAIQSIYVFKSLPPST